jgi:hypothetical protein
VYCPKCGAYNSEGSKFCQACGTPKLSVTPTPPPPVATSQTSSPAARQTSGLAVAALVTGIIGFVFPPGTILAMVLGGIALSQIKKTPDMSGRGIAIAGLVLGIVTVVGWAMLIVFYPY